MGRVKRIWFLSPMRVAKVQASLRIRAVSPEPPLLAHTSSETRGSFRQKARALAPLNAWACAVKVCHDGMLEDTNSLDASRMIPVIAIINRHLKTFYLKMSRSVWVLSGLKTSEERFSRGVAHSNFRSPEEELAAPRDQGSDVLERMS